MDYFKPNIKVELVTLWSHAEAKPVEVIKLIVNRKIHEKPQVHFFDLESLIKKSESDKNNYDENFKQLFNSLTKREQEILVNVAKGATSIEISEKFYISANTVKNHRRNIKLKLDLGDTIKYSKFLRWVFLNVK